MEATTFTFADLSRFLKRAPNIKTYAIPTTIFLVVDFLLVRDVILTVTAFVVPLASVIVLDNIFVRAAKFHFPRRRINYLDFLSFFFAEIYFVIVRLAFPNFLNIQYAIMLTFATTGLLRSMVLYTYYSDSYRKIALPSLIYAVAVMIGLTFSDLNRLSYLYFLLMAVIFSFGGYLFADVSVSGFKDEFGQSPIKILNFFLNSRGPGSSEDDARKFFRKIYNRETEVPVQVIDIVRKEGGRKVILVFPYIHPGPFGNIGTSNIPHKLQERLSDFKTDLMVFHTTTTNSNNSASEEDIDGIAESARKALGNIPYQDSISQFKRIGVGGHVLGLLKFGQYGLGAMIPAEERFDDVSLSQGLKMISEMKKSGASDFITVDAQTHFLQGARSLDDLTDIISAARAEYETLRASSTPRIGYSRTEVEAKAMGPLGIQCLVLETESGMQALVLTDSNNITDELIELARRKTAGFMDDIEFFTTDNHYINAGTLDMNPLGQRDEPEMLAGAIADCVKAAMNDIEECRIGMSTEYARVSMGEETTFKRLLESVHSSIRKARFTIIAVVSLCLVSSISLSYLVFYIMNFR